MAIKEISATLSAEGLSFGIVVARFNDFLTKQLLGGAVDGLVRHGAKEEQITVVWVPGSNEIPMAAERLAAHSKLNAIIALGVVIQGATPHAGLITGQVSNSLAALASSSGVPVINGVIAAETLEQAIERSGTKAANKGWQAAQAAIEMANVYKALGVPVRRN